MTEIAASNLSKSFGVKTVLENITFNVNKGEHVGIIGGNGAGKSTLLKILAGRDDDIDGEIFIAPGKRVGYLRQEAGSEGDGPADITTTERTPGAESVETGNSSAYGPTVFDVMRRAYDET
ncbi:MAG: ATP-binding cassette domain-containing protein, partial [Clostridiales Family XIII bacterium]|nr:ATP-binding cassette domain-containing protein [Clostridiales Family XIII bacterium]